MTSGLDNILANLTKIQVKAPKAARGAVTEVAEEFEKALKSTLPFMKMKIRILEMTRPLAVLKEPMRV